VRVTGTPPADSSHVEGEQRRREELERVVSSLEATTAIAQALVGEASLDVVLDLIATRGRELVDASWSAIMIVDGDDLELRATSGDREMRPIGRRYSLDETFAGEVLRGGKPRMVSNLSRRVAEEDRMLVRELGAEQALFVPLEFRGRGVGVLTVASVLDEKEGFDAEQEHLLVAFAASAATAVVTAQSVVSDRLRQTAAAAELERRRWARELHDETLQELGAVMMLIDTARGSGRPEALDAILDRVAGSLETTIAGLNRMISELRPVTLDELGVGAAVHALAKRRETDELEITVTIDLDYECGRRANRLAPEVESAIYRIVQEALANVAKHARAAHAEVVIVEENNSVTVDVCDDGRGLGSSDTSGTGLGLAGMRERISLLGGQLEIGPGPAGGTAVHASLPALRSERET
jgi:signal transduction histidine kinase